MFGSSGAELRVDDDAVVDGEAGGRGELGARHDADRDQHGIAGDLAAVVEADAGDTVRAEDRDDLAAETDVDACLAMAGAHALLDRRRDGAGHQPRAGLDHHHLGAEATAFDATSRPMKPPPITTSRLPLPRRARSASEFRDVAHGGDARQIGAGDGEAPRLGAGGEQEPLIGDHRAVGEHDLAAGTADRADGGPGKVRDVLAAIRILVVEGEIGGRLLAGEHALRQRRPLVGGVALRADQRDRPLPAGVAERMGRAAAGVPGADDDHAAVAHDRRPVRPAPKPSAASERRGENSTPNGFAESTASVRRSRASAHSGRSPPPSRLLRRAASRCAKRRGLDPALLACGYAQ